MRAPFLSGFFQEVKKQVVHLELVNVQVPDAKAQGTGLYRHRKNFLQYEPAQAPVPIKRQQDSKYEELASIGFFPLHGIEVMIASAVAYGAIFFCRNILL